MCAGGAGGASVTAVRDVSVARSIGSAAAKDFEVIANLVNAAPAMGSVDDLLSSLDLAPFSSNLQCKSQAQSSTKAHRTGVAMRTRGALSAT